MADLIQSLIAKFQNFDRNADGDPAIASLSYLAFESSSEDIPQDARLVLVLVEPRLLNPMPGAEDLIPILLRYKGDLRAEGLFSRFIRADVYHGQRHQDGRTLLAMRSFLREVKLSFSKLEGVILVVRSRRPPSSGGASGRSTSATSPSAIRRPRESTISASGPS